MNSSKTSNKPGRNRPTLPSPRELMRARHPDLFSDSTVAARPSLPRPVFDHFLDTLTARKEEYQFEHFCRLIAEKEICPNLRVQTGPTGGGDSKVDSENYPVASEISERWWFGEQAGGAERWAFAFSAKKKWKPKLEADVASILGTQRPYRRIYFFTNQLVSDKTRAKTEDTLTQGAGIPVHIFDRNQLIHLVYEKGHLDLAVRALHIEDVPVEAVKLGALDTERKVELDQLDAQIADPGRYEGARYQLVEDCIRGAILARTLERGRYEVEGRFSAAERIAADVGLTAQQMRLAYLRAWTAFWWYEDVGEFLAHYDVVEQLAGRSDEAEDLGRLCTLYQLLVTAQRLKQIAPERTRATERRSAIVGRLDTLHADRSRPNNAMLARMLRAFIRLTDTMADRDPDCSAVWAELSSIAEASRELGQFPFELLAKMVRGLSDQVDTPEFDTLYALIVDIQRQRVSDGEAGESFRSRGVQKLLNGKPYDAIRWLGRAEELFAKDEYRRELIFTLLESSYAFERAGLLWAARSKLIAAVERSFHTLLVSGELPKVGVYCLKRLMWVEVQIGRIPHVLQATTWWHFCATRFDASKPSDADEARLLDAVLGIHFLNVPAHRLEALQRLPDALYKLGLGMARLAVLYVLGHEDRVQADAFAADPQSSSELLAFFERWHDQPAREDIPAQPLLNDGPLVELRSTILGSEVVVSGPNEPTAIGISESLLGALEALLATSDERDVLAHTEKTHIRLRKVEGHRAAPTFEWLHDIPGVQAELVVGESVEFTDQEAFEAFANFLVEAALNVASRQFTIRDPQSWIHKVAGEERGLSRAALFGNVLVLGRNLFGSEPRVQLQDWISEGDAFFEVKRVGHWRPKDAAPAAGGEPARPLKFGSGRPPEELTDTSQRKHTQRKVISPIDLPAWNAARWGGACYGCDFVSPPIMSLMFRDLDAGARIFTEWRSRWGQQDVEDALRVAIVTGVSQRHPYHYAVVVGPNLDKMSAELRPGVTVSTVSRILHMTPDSPENLNTFLREYGKFQAFFLAPARLPQGQVRAPEILYELALLKRSVLVRPAWQIGENDLDMVALLDDEDPLIPDGVADAPVLKAMALRRERRDRS